MNNEKTKKCKQKDCNNSVLDGRYCEHCKQKRKESRNKVIALVSPVILGLGVMIKKGPKIASEVIKVISRKA